MLSQDKGRTIVLEDPSTYTEKFNKLKMLYPPDVEERNKTYVRLDKDTTKNVKRKLIEKLMTQKDAGEII